MAMVPPKKDNEIAGGGTTITTTAPPLIAEYAYSPDSKFAVDMKDLTTIIQGKNKNKLLSPPPGMENRADILHNLLDNTTVENIDETCNMLELITDVSPLYWNWLAQDIVMKRIPLEPGHHPRYLYIIAALGEELYHAIYLETYRNIHVILQSPKLPEKFADRQHLKLYGQWLGLLILTANRIIEDDDLDLKMLMVEAYRSGNALDLMYVIPFVTTLMTNCLRSTKLKPPHPWTIGIIQVLAELYTKLKPSLKFEIDLFLKDFKLYLPSIRPSNILNQETSGYFIGKTQLTTNEALLVRFNPIVYAADMENGDILPELNIEEEIENQFYMDKLDKLYGAVAQKYFNNEIRTAEEFFQNETWCKEIASDIFAVKYLMGMYREQEQALTAAAATTTTTTTTNDDQLIPQPTPTPPSPPPEEEEDGEFDIDIDPFQEREAKKAALRIYEFVLKKYYSKEIQTAEELFQNKELCKEIADDISLVKELMAIFEAQQEETATCDDDLLPQEQPPSPQEQPPSPQEPKPQPPSPQEPWPQEPWPQKPWPQAPPPEEEEIDPMEAEEAAEASARRIYRAVFIKYFHNEIRSAEEFFQNEEWRKEIAEDIFRVKNRMRMNQQVTTPIGDDHLIPQLPPPELMAMYQQEQEVTATCDDDLLPQEPPPSCPQQPCPEEEEPNPMQQQAMEEAALRIHAMVIKRYFSNEIQTVEEFLQNEEWCKEIASDMFALNHYIGMYHQQQEEVTTPTYNDHLIPQPPPPPEIMGMYQEEQEVTATCDDDLLPQEPPPSWPQPSCPQQPCPQQPCPEEEGPNPMQKQAAEEAALRIHAVVLQKYFSNQIQTAEEFFQNEEWCKEIANDIFVYKNFLGMCQQQQEVIATCDDGVLLPQGPPQWPQQPWPAEEEPVPMQYEIEEQTPEEGVMYHQHQYDDKAEMLFPDASPPLNEDEESLYKQVLTCEQANQYAMDNEEQAQTPEQIPGATALPPPTLAFPSGPDCWARWAADCEYNRY